MLHETFRSRKFDPKSHFQGTKFLVKTHFHGSSFVDLSELFHDTSLRTCSVGLLQAQAISLNLAGKPRWRRPTSAKRNLVVKVLRCRTDMIYCIIFINVLYYSLCDWNHFFPVSNLIHVCIPLELSLLSFGWILRLEGFFFRKISRV